MATCMPPTSTLTHKGSGGSRNMLLYQYLNQCRRTFRGWEHDSCRRRPIGITKPAGHTDGGSMAVAFSPDGKLLAECAEVAAWRRQTGNNGPWRGEVVGRGQRATAPTLTGHARAVHERGLQPRQETPGHHVILAAQERRRRRVHIIDGVGRGELARSTGHPEELGTSACGLQPRRQTPGLRLMDNRWRQLKRRPEPVKVWDAATGQEILTLKGQLTGLERGLQPRRQTPGQRRLSDRALATGSR